MHENQKHPRLAFQQPSIEILKQKFRVSSSCRKASRRAWLYLLSSTFPLKLWFFFNSLSSLFSSYSSQIYSLSTSLSLSLSHHPSLLFLNTSSLSNQLIQSCIIQLFWVWGLLWHVVSISGITPLKKTNSSLRTVIKYQQLEMGLLVHPAPSPFCNLVWLKCAQVIGMKSQVLWCHMCNCPIVSKRQFPWGHLPLRASADQSCLPLQHRCLDPAGRDVLQTLH